MHKETKANLLLAYLGMSVFLIGTFIPLSAIQIQRQVQLPITDIGLFNYNICVAICLLLVNVGLLGIGERWIVTKIIGYFYVISSLAWLVREICGTATNYSIISIFVMVITALLIYIQNRKR